jgi:hypothetical protein
MQTVPAEPDCESPGAEENDTGREPADSHDVRREIEGRGRIDPEHDKADAAQRWIYTLH